jgi:hypothetical protein
LIGTVAEQVFRPWPFVRRSYRTRRGDDDPRQSSQAGALRATVATHYRQEGPGVRSQRGRKPVTGGLHRLVLPRCSCRPERGAQHIASYGALGADYRARQVISERSARVSQIRFQARSLSKAYDADPPSDRNRKARDLYITESLSAVHHDISIYEGMTTSPKLYAEAASRSLLA